MSILKKIGIAITLGLLVSFSFSCATVSRVEYDENIELDGYWSDNDVRVVCDDIISQVLKSPEIAQFEIKNGRIPLVTIGNIKNVSDEYINTDIVANNLKTAIIKSGKLGFMANKDFRQDLRQEVSDQADYANPNQAKEFANEDAADYMLSGSIDNMVQFDGKNTSLRTYYVTIELNDVETHRTIDVFQPAPENQPRKILKGKRR